MPIVRVTAGVAMEPSFWSWEKLAGPRASAPSTWRRNGAQLLELGKARGGRRVSRKSACRNGAQLLELGKDPQPDLIGVTVQQSQWSPAFGAGKRSYE